MEYRDQERAETQYRRNREGHRPGRSRLKTIMDSIQFGVMLIDAETHTIEDLNPTAASMIGDHRDRVIGSVCHQYICPAERGRCPVTDLGQEIDKSEQLLISSGNKTIPIIKSVVPVELDGRKYLLESFLDISDRKRREESLRRSEQREWLQVVLSSIGDAVIAVDKEGRVTFMNPVAKQLTGYTLAEALGNPIRTVFNIINKKTREPLEVPCESVIREGLVIDPSEDTALISKDLQERSITDSAVPIKDKAGKIIGAVIVFRDISESLEVAESMRSSEEKFNKAFNYLPNLMCISSMDGVYQEVNSAFTQILGYSREEAVGSRTLDLGWVNPEDRAKFVRVLNGEGVVRDLEFNFRRKDGRIIFALISAVKITIGGTDYILTTLNDITRRKQAEENLRISEQKYRTIFENAIEGIYLSTPEGRLIDANPALAEMYGYSSPEELISQITDIGRQIYAREEDRREILRILEEQDYIKDFEVEILHKDGKKRRMSFNIHTVRDKNGWIQYLEGTCVDITERKRTEEQLKYLSLNDVLTGLYNRYFFEEELKRLDDLCTPVGIIMCDVDGLKLVNDTLGHKAGDEMLVSASRVIKRCFREGDVIARVGGDEFSILLSSVEEAVLEKAVNRIRSEVDRYNTKSPDLPLSISIGSAYRTDHTLSIYDLFKRADNNMYREKLRSSLSARSAIVQTLMKAMEARDFNTEEHSGRLQRLITDLTRKINLTEPKPSDLLLFAQFHDIGKVGIPDRILFKPGPLSEEERTEMQRHSEIGHRIAQASPDLAPISDMILKHHEWWNGQGYPFGLKGEEIPIECRILSIVDAYDAMISDRPYRKALSHEEAVAELIRCRGTQFDPVLIDQFLSIL